MPDLDINTRSCITPSGLIKWVLLISSGVILGLILYEDIKAGDRGSSRIHEGEGYVLICAAVTLVMVFLLLLGFSMYYLFFLNCHTGRGICSNSQCANITILLYFLGLLAWLAAAGVEIWVAHDWRGSKGGKEKLFERRCAAAALSILNAILFFLLGHQIRVYSNY